MQTLIRRLDKISKNIGTETEPRLILIDKTNQDNWHLRLSYWGGKNKTTINKDLYIDDYKQYIGKFKGSKDVAIIIDDID